MALDLLVLGSNAAMPAYGRFTSAQLLKKDSSYYLIDCGEGTQIRLSQYKVKRNNIKAIFITHLHGDHIFGLPGVLTSFFHFQRKEPLLVYGPPGIKELLENIFRLTECHLAYEINIIEHSPHGLEPIYKDKHIEVSAFPLQHRIQTNGYKFKEKTNRRKIIKTELAKYNLSVDQIKSIIAEQDIQLVSGELISYNDLLHPQEAPRSFAYCSDTIYDENIIDYVKGVNLLYHETTYMDDLHEKARLRGHSTTLEAARIANLAGVEKLLIGHYSGKYKNVEPLLEEAKTIFPHSLRAYDGEMISI
jgi:ribonuclease Z